MLGHTPDPIDRNRPPEKETMESPPAPENADVPPPLTVEDEDYLDGLENRRRKPLERWGTDLVLALLYIMASTILIAAVWFLRHHLRR